MYEYKAYVTRVYDGDTITVDISLGFGVYLNKQTLRLARINTPEVRGEERPQGLISRDALRDRIIQQNVIIHTDKDRSGKYGRWIAEVFLESENINDWLLQEGYAEEYQE